jgi:hypothetical protein
VEGLTPAALQLLLQLCKGDTPACQRGVGSSTCCGSGLRVHSATRARCRGPANACWRLCRFLLSAALQVDLSSILQTFEHASNVCAAQLSPVALQR